MIFEGLAGNLNLLDTRGRPVLGYRLQLASQSKLELAVTLEESPPMPFDVKNFPILGPDIAELFAVALTLVFSLAVMVVLGRWWSK